MSPRGRAMQEWGTALGQGMGKAKGLGPPRTGTEYMVLMLLLNFSVASMNRLSMGVFWERRSFICKERGTVPAVPPAWGPALLARLGVALSSPKFSSGLRYLRDHSL